MRNVTCTVEDCETPPSVRGWCNAHYLRWRRHGDPQSGGIRPQPAPADGLCTVPDCKRNYLARGYCQFHYGRWRKHGNPLKGGPKPTAPVVRGSMCTVDGCGKESHRTTYCYAHYMKNYRYGTPTPKHQPWREDIRGARYGTLVVQDWAGDAQWACQCDCGEAVTRAAGSLNREGDANTCGVPNKHLDPFVGYSGAHERVRSARGAASDHSCITCGKQALHWSYRHDDPDEMFDEMLANRPMAYSVNPDHYDPRCVPCHKKFDLDRINGTHWVNAAA